MYSRIAIGVVILVAGCGGGSTHHRAQSSQVSSPAAVASKTVEAPLTAADGTRLGACRKGRCEVLVAPGDKITPPARYGLQVITVKSVSSGGVSYVGTGPGITLSFSGQRAGMTSYMNRLAITTVAVRDGKAVARFAPK
ncbi:hypothetical protein [Actinomadura sp. DC4]|uniref:hypothetical protein n=1 Tax=Actinomadura sp. DC4 TaxID=3055069 RepID=UPI0025B0046F|nr:hypothetical protein [Actinomadura sp. DC4]MDN3358211.1 hypothetical protein [Actinomadura sp. DC4]